ncbi:MAG TPA: hypothetical protein VFX98_06410 [Longimicrobiaceae bacterium]|nr:hypothetical protein [Longimicrobiaceae bacterium]
MHTEHLQNVRPSWVAFGWFIGAAVFSLLTLAMIAAGILDTEGARPADAFWLLLAMFLGYMVGGYFTGARVGAAPILHAVGIGLFSVVFWFVVNVAGEPFGGDAWRSLSPAFFAGVILLQIFSAATGARIGSRAARAATAQPS